jgi:choline-glycine betaine transporter
MAQLCPYVIIWVIKYGALGNIVDSIAVIAFIGALLIAGNSGAAENPFSVLRIAIIIGALPFAIIMVLTMIGLGKAICLDGLRERAMGNKYSGQTHFFF